MAVHDLFRCESPLVCEGRCCALPIIGHDHLPEQYRQLEFSKPLTGRGSHPADSGREGRKRIGAEV
jgi:hypothetical protein